MKRALVLSGGGTKGAYQSGVMKAIKELNIKYDIVTGTSIGALVGCLIAQDDLEALHDLFAHLEITDIMTEPLNLEFSIDSLMSQTELLVPFLKSYFNHKGADITPLKNLIDKLCNEEKLLASPIDFGLVTVAFPSLKPVEITKEKMKGNLKNYLLASASCFPAFPICEFDGNSYIDGGYYDNLPIDLALEMGADEIIAVELTHDRITHPEYENRPNIKVIRPSQYNGQFLDFNVDLKEHRLILGYNDTMKILGDFEGKSYTFYPDDQEQLYQSFYKELLKYEANLNRDFFRKRMKVINTKPLTEIIEQRKIVPEIKDYFILGIEVLADAYHIDPFKVYHMDEMIHILYDKVHPEEIKYEELLSKDKDPAKQKEFLASLDRTDLIIYIYGQMKKEKDFNENVLYTFFNTELLCAFIYNAIKEYVNEN